MKEVCMEMKRKKKKGGDEKIGEGKRYREMGVIRKEGRRFNSQKKQNLAFYGSFFLDYARVIIIFVGCILFF